MDDAVQQFTDRRCFGWPAYVNHGAFASKDGILGFGRTDGELNNHFHHNAYSNPDENTDRAAARLIRQKPELNKWMYSHGLIHFDFEFGEHYAADSTNDRVHIPDTMHALEMNIPMLTTIVIISKS